MSAAPFGKPAPTDLPLLEAIRQRYSVCVFDGQPLAPGELELLLEAARWAPSAFNEQPWRFCVAPRQDREGFAHLLSLLAPFNQQWAEPAAALAIVSASAQYARNDKPNAHAWHDTGLATAQLAVQASSMGIQVHPMAGFDTERAREELGLPEGFDPLTALAIGRPGDPDSAPKDIAERERQPRTRRPLGEIAYGAGWETAPRLD